MLRTAGALFAWLLASACTVPAGKPVETPVPATDILVFGDTGYDYDWLDEEDHAQPLDARSYLIAALDDWIEDKRPIQEFRPSPFHFAAQTGGWVAASGLQAVAEAMRAWCADPARCDFGVMLGDNIYPNGATLGTDGRDDARRFDDLLFRPFIGLQQQDPEFVIYPVLGNHDWYTSREGALAQVEWMQQTSLYRIDGFFYRAMAAPEVEIFAFDSTVLLAGHTVYEESIAEDGSAVSSGVVEQPMEWMVPRGPEREMAAWLERSLRESTARWKIVIAHHPIWSSSSGKYEQAKVLRETVLPALCRYADALLVGHEHTLEVHTDDCSTVLGEPDVLPLVQLVSGAGAKQRPLHSTFMSYQDRVYPQKTTHYARGQVWGFAALRLEAEEGEITVLTIPDSGGSETSVDFTYRFARRSGRAAGTP